MCFFPGCDASAARMAQLSDSEPHDVNTISLVSAAPISVATCSRACSTACFIVRPSVCADDGLPKKSLRYGCIASNTSRCDACRGVVIEIDHLSPISPELIDGRIHSHRRRYRSA